VTSPEEATALARQMARTARDMYVAFLSAGFDDLQAIHLTTQLMVAMVAAGGKK